MGHFYGWGTGGSSLCDPPVGHGNSCVSALVHRFKQGLSVFLTCDSVYSLNRRIASVKCFLLPVKHSFSTVCLRQESVRVHWATKRMCACVYRLAVSHVMKPVEKQKVGAYDHQNRVNADGLWIPMEHRFCKSKKIGIRLQKKKG